MSASSGADGGKRTAWLLVAAQALHSVAYALWLGGIISIGALVAPAVFGYTRHLPLVSDIPGLPDMIAGGILGGVFHDLCYLSLAAGVVMLFTDTLEFVTGMGARFRTATFVRSLLTIAMLVVVGYQTFHILPIMDRPSVRHTTLFDALHAQDVFLTQLQVPVLLIIACLTAYRNVTHKQH